MNEPTRGTTLEYEFEYGVFRVSCGSPASSGTLLQSTLDTKNTQPPLHADRQHLTGRPRPNPPRTTSRSQPTAFATEPSPPPRPNHPPAEPPGKPPAARQPIPSPGHNAPMTPSLRLALPLLLLAAFLAAPLPAQTPPQDQPTGFVAAYLAEARGKLEAGELVDARLAAARALERDPNTLPSLSLLAVIAQRHAAFDTAKHTLYRNRSQAGALAAADRVALEQYSPVGTST